MNNLIYIAIGLAIVLILAFVLLRSKNTTPPPRKPAAVTPPRPVHDRASQAAVPGAAAAPNYQDRLTVAQRFIDQQRYDDAISELKQGLGSHPKNKDLTLKLLNIYALTNRTEAFSDLYQTIQMQGDAATLAAADNIKSLLDEEQASSRPAPVAASDSFVADSHEEGLDFNLLDDTTVEHAPAAIETTAASEELLELDSVEPEEEVLSFDDLENQLLADDGPATQPEHAATVNAVTAIDMDEGLDFNFDDADTESLSLETSEPTQPVADDSAFSLELDEPATITTTSETVATDDAFSLDDDFDFSSSSTLDSSTVTSDAPAEDAPQTDTNDFLELDNLVAEDTTTDSLHTELADAAAATQTIELDATDMEHNELSFADIESNELGMDDDFSFTTDAVTTEESAPTDTNSSFSLETEEASDLTADSLATEEPVVANHIAESAPAAAVAEYADVEPTSADFAETAQSADTPVSTPDDSQFAADFDYVNELDSVQVTIDLAAQYLELGEYESAKRLLKEVANQGNAEQQSQVESLLARAV